ncbi:MULTISPECIES: matrixin family metalloprotease [Lactobacillus]|uniref:Matrixin family metalloprotease n=1 Tax=Lactobacillus xujianguonis TaxID=2495899 RepID=A0A437SV32_9LACO|nr:MULTISPECIES: matrixin family metalloprotease [Lactobacillus]RVU70677.1 matrixin family metalloprotease [Lactobacillus xujianguonis]RVU77150.1 matrixin family metalloprotease [Lactobacillus xujianguonis]
MKHFFHFLQNIIFLGIIFFGIWFYQTSPNVRIATNDSLQTLHQRLSQIVTTGNLAPPKLSDPDQTDQATTGKKAVTDRWSKPEATIYVDLNNNHLLRSATLDAISLWNRTGAFTFKQVNNAKAAQIIVKAVDESNTSAAGETSTSYNLATGHLLKATVNLNRFYLQNVFYGYSYNRVVNTAEHELGHAIGLSHNNGVSVMYPKGSFYTIQPIDIEAVKKLYNED